MGNTNRATRAGFEIDSGDIARLLKRHMGGAEHSFAKKLSAYGPGAGAIGVRRSLGLSHSLGGAAGAGGGAMNASRDWEAAARAEI